MLGRRLLLVALGGASFVGTAVRFHGCLAEGMNRLHGTVSKTSGSGTITGVGTSFLTEVKVGYRLHIPGGATDEYGLVVTAIASNTSLTVSPAPTSTASGQLCEPDFGVPNVTFTPIKYEQPGGTHESFDTDLYHYSSSAALTGTVAKTTGFTTLVGTGTAFLTELGVNQVIDVPGGGGIDTLVVTAIADDTHLAVANAPTHTASGQTATGNPAAIAIPAGLGGYYLLGLEDDWRGGGGTVREGNIFKNVSTGGAIGPDAAVGGVNVARVDSTSGETAYKWSGPRLLLEGDFLVNLAYQDSGATLNMTPFYAMWAIYLGPA